MLGTVCEHAKAVAGRKTPNAALFCTFLVATPPADVSQLGLAWCTSLHQKKNSIVLLQTQTAGHLHGTPIRLLNSYGYATRSPAVKATTVCSLQLHALPMSVLCRHITHSGRRKAQCTHRPRQLSALEVLVGINHASYLETGRSGS